MQFELACPSCHGELARAPLDSWRCNACASTYPREDGIYRFLRFERIDAVSAFVKRYSTVRAAEGRGRSDAAYLRALPFRDLTRQHSYEWSIRARTFRAFVSRVLVPLERAHRAPLRVLDLGSGVGWLAYRLARRGHRVLAVDLLTSEVGLGVHQLYPIEFASVQAEFDALPVRDGSVDAVVFNASFHCAVDCARTLAEALRVLARGGNIVIMDSPLYRDASSGVAMTRERDTVIERKYGVAPEVDASEGFLTYEALERLARVASLRWKMHTPWLGVQWLAKPWIARVLGRREPARFKLIVGRRAFEP